MPRFSGCKVVNFVKTKDTTMTQHMFVSYASKGFILVSASALLFISLTAFDDPQKLMDLVQVKLTNNDAYSSIRGVYGGVGMTLVLLLIYWMFQEIRTGLACLVLLWGFYVLSRVLTWLWNGPLNAFGKQWLGIESILFVVASCLLFLNFQMTNKKG